MDIMPTGKSRVALDVMDGSWPLLCGLDASGVSSIAAEIAHVM